jgi:rubrerythrin
MAAESMKDGILELIKIIDKAIMMEHNAQAFYRTAGRNTGSAEGKKMFEWLVNFEANHEAKLQAKRDELLSLPDMKDVEPPPLDEESKLSEASTVSNLPPKPSDVDVLRVAIEGEQRAYAYYNRKFTHAADEHIKTMFQTMAKEEERHIKILSEMRRHLQVEGIWMDLEEADKATSHDS